MIMTNCFSYKNERKKPALVLENLRGSWSDCQTSSPLPLIATVAPVKSLDNFRFFALGTLANFTVLVACLADRFVGLVARLHRFDLATLETFLVRGRVFVTSCLIAVLTDGFAGLVAHCHRFDLATLETFLVRGRVFVTSHLIAVLTDGFAGLLIFIDSRLLLADIAKILHGFTSFWFWVDLEKSKFRSPDLISYPTLLLALRQGHVQRTK